MWLKAHLAPRALAAAGALVLFASLLPLSDVMAGSPQHFFMKSGIRSDRTAVSEADVVGMTQQKITSAGLRWISFEAGGRWHTMNERNRLISGTWEIKDGMLCIKGREWFPQGSCSIYYRQDGEIIGYTPVAYPDLFLPTSFFRTDDPTDGANRTMRGVAGKSGAYPFPARIERLFPTPQELSGWRIDVANPTRYWFELRPSGRLDYGHADLEKERGKWRVNEYGDLCLKAAEIWENENCFDLLGGRSVAAIRGVRDIGDPFRFFPAQLRRLDQ